MPILLLLALLPSLALADEIVKPDQPFMLGWTPATNAEGYEVERSLDGGTYLKIDEVIEPAVQTTLSEKQEATYRVRSWNDNDGTYRVGEYSDSSELFTADSPPTDPTALQILEEQP